jgi:hypothetical protein
MEYAARLASLTSVVHCAIPLLMPMVEVPEPV